MIQLQSTHQGSKTARQYNPPQGTYLYSKILQQQNSQKQQKKVVSESEPSSQVSSKRSSVLLTKIPQLDHSTNSKTQSTAQLSGQGENNFATPAFDQPKIKPKISHHKYHKSSTTLTSQTRQVSGNRTRNIQGTFSESLVDNALGPGSYNISQQFGENSPKITMHGRLQTERIKQSQNPGPGEYYPRESLSRERVKSPLFKGSERFEPLETDKDSPGPGNYYKEEYFARKATPITLKGRIQEKVLKSNEPGPGAYNPKDDIVKSAVLNIKLSSSQRPISQKRQGRNNDIPGPGTYSYRQKGILSDALTITLKGKLPDIKKNSDLPGPGAYDVSRKSMSPTVKIVRTPDRSSSKLRDDNLGPGAYYYKNKSIGTDGPKFSLGTRASQKIQRDESPGPAQYEPIYCQVRSTSRSFVIKGKESRNNSNHSQDMPGPGAYNPNKTIGHDALKFSIKGRVEHVNKQSVDIPGPGAYSAGYELVQDRVKSPNLRFSERRSSDLFHNQQLPGPGYYDQQSTIGRNSPMITLKPRIERSNSRDNSPGPGQYNPSDQLTKSTVLAYSFDGQSLKLSNRTRDELHSNTLRNTHTQFFQDNNFTPKREIESSNSTNGQLSAIKVKPSGYKITLPQNEQSVATQFIEEYSFQQQKQSDISKPSHIRLIDAQPLKFISDGLTIEKKNENDAQMEKIDVRAQMLQGHQKLVSKNSGNKRQGQSPYQLPKKFAIQRTQKQERSRSQKRQ